MARVISYEVTDDEENEQAEIDDQARENLWSILLLWSSSNLYHANNLWSFFEII